VLVLTGNIVLLWQSAGGVFITPPAHHALHLSVIHDRAEDSLAPGGENQVVRKNGRWSRSPQAQGSLLLTLGVLRQIGQHGGRCDPSTVKGRE